MVSVRVVRDVRAGEAKLRGRVSAAIFRVPRAPRGNLWCRVVSWRGVACRGATGARPVPGRCSVPGCRVKKFEIVVKWMRNRCEIIVKSM